MDDLRAMPSVDSILNEKNILNLISQFGRSVVREAARETLALNRSQYFKTNEIPDAAKLYAQISNTIYAWFAPTLFPVINATGVILHTNLGRAPLSRAAIEAINAVSANYSTLEYDLKNGQRGMRSLHTESLLTRISGAEAALVVNNNAAALLLILSALLRHKKVIISRTQLVEIGGSFRIPDIMMQSGTKLVEVGATNKVHLEDYREALLDGAAAILHTHHSNFKMLGFTSEPTLFELSALEKADSVILIEDLGSGALISTERYGLAHEITVQEAVASGADLICFSGDKLLGGPQAGIIVGKKQLVDKLKKSPLARAVRADKICLAGLSATLLHYLRDEAESNVPIWQMISRTDVSLKNQAENWKDVLGAGEIYRSTSAVGGGSLPGETLPTYVLGIKTDSAERFIKSLRQQPTPIIARIEDDMVVFDPRTIDEAQNLIFITQMKKMLPEANKRGGPSSRNEVNDEVGN